MLILDQTRLPGVEVYLECRSLEQVAGAIERLSVRGAPAIGVAAAMGLALAAQQTETPAADVLAQRCREFYDRLLATRPTAVNLRWALDRMMRRLDSLLAMPVADIKAALVRDACAMLQEDISANEAMGRHGRDLIPRQGAVMTICNTGSLATGGFGTALGVIRAAVAGGHRISVVACETRPLLQGARLTAWELQQDGIPFELITDSAAGSYMRTRGVDCVIIGADRIAANGDTANKIGSYTLAVLAAQHSVPFYVAAPTATVDLHTASGADIPIETRDAGEVLGFNGTPVAPAGTAVWNPAFDVVPHCFINAIVTERGVVRPPFDTGLHQALRGLES